MLPHDVEGGAVGVEVPLGGRRCDMRAAGEIENEEDQAASSCFILRCVVSVLMFYCCLCVRRHNGGLEWNGLDKMCCTC